MNETTANNVVEALTDAIKEDAKAILKIADTACWDMHEENRDAAIGGMCPLDDILERVQAAVIAARAIHKAAR